jgi:CRP/FNR family transcriptional regulator, cyclic AMP receptor protein
MRNDAQEKLDKFFLNRKTVFFEKNEVIFRPEDEPQGIFYLKEGYVKMNSVFENGKELTLNIFKPGSFFPMLWAIGEIQNDYYFTSWNKSVLYKAPKEEFLKFLTSNPEVLFDLTKRILIGLNGILTNTKFFLFGDAYHRVLASILLCALRFGVKSGPQQLKVNIPLTHQDLANLSGITRETVSATMIKLEKEKVLSYHRHELVLFDINKLKNSLEDFGDQTQASLII